MKFLHTSISNVINCFQIGQSGSNGASKCIKVMFIAWQTPEALHVAIRRELLVVEGGLRRGGRHCRRLRAAQNTQPAAAVSCSHIVRTEI